MEEVGVLSQGPGMGKGLVTICADIFRPLAAHHASAEKLEQAVHTCRQVVELAFQIVGLPDGRRAQRAWRGWLCPSPGSGRGQAVDPHYLRAVL